jgi:hypothetical protein
MHVEVKTPPFRTGNLIGVRSEILKNERSSLPLRGKKTKFNQD